MITFTEVTWYSKLAAVIFFIGVLPVLTFYIGMKYQEVISITYVAEDVTPAIKKVPTEAAYSYECDEHVQFQFSSNNTLSTLYLKPVGASEYPPVSTLVQKQTTSGVRYEGNGIVLTGKGESVTLGEGDNALHCSPVLVKDEAPLNFGD